MSARLGSLFLKWIFAKGKLQLTPSQVRALLLTAAFVLFPFVFYLSWYITPLLLLFVAWRYFLEVRQTALPSFYTKLALLIIVISIILLDQGTLLGRDAGTSFLMGLLGIKLLELRTSRDFTVVCLLSFFMVAGALLFSQSIFMVGYLLVAIVLIFAALARLHSTSSDHGECFSSWQFSSRIFLQSLPLAILIFLCFPRFQARWAFQLRPATTGLSDFMQPGDIAHLATDERVAFRVDFPEEGKPSGALYWRGLVFWNTDGREWHVGARHLSQQKLVPKEASVLQKITLMPHSQKWMFALDYPMASPPGTSIFWGNVIESRTIIFRKMQYSVRSSIGAHPQDMSEDIKKKSLQLPKQLSPRIVQLVTAWQARAKSPHDIIRSALNYFHDGGFLYTLNPGRYDNLDPYGDFLFNRKRGFCEHFAGSFALMMRIAGIPSRLVAGYMGGEYNPYGHFLTVRQANAHVWTEVWISNEGWVRVDPTGSLSLDQIEQSVQNLLNASGAASGGEDTRDAGASGILAHRFVRIMHLWRELVEDRWDRWVLGYDMQVQEDFFKSLGIGSFAWLVIFATFGGVLFFTLLGVAWWLKRRSKSADPLEGMYRSFCRRLSAAGVERSLWEGPVDFAQRAAQSLPSDAREIKKIGILYAELRYGPSHHTHRMAEFQSQLRAFRPKERSHEI